MRLSPTRRALAVLAILGCAVWIPARVGAVANPTVTGPIRANAPPGDPSHDYPFFTFAPQLAALKGPHRYVEEEFAPSQLASRQPDTDEYRRWEVAGAAHADFYFVDYLTPLGARDGIPPTPMGCDNPPLSRMPFYEVGNAAGDALVRWMTDGTPPPIGPPIEFTSISPPVIARDALGLARGGIRLPDIEAPLALNTGTNSGPAFCLLFGTSIPFDDATLHQLYPRRADWISAFTQALRDAYGAGFIVKKDHRLNLQRGRHTQPFQ